MTREWKKKEVEELKQLLEDHPVVGVTSMYKIPAAQLQEMRKDLHGKAKIKMSRKTLMKIALDEADVEGGDKLKDHLKGEAAFIFTEMNPFKLYSYLQENKSSAPAQAGDIAPNDITIPEGGTGIDPGPAIGKLQNAGIKTSIDEGEIQVAEESKIVEDGEEVTHEVAEALKMLDLEPMEIGLSLKAVWEDGNVFKPDDLDIDVEEYEERVKGAYQKAMNLSINAGYMTRENVRSLLRKARGEASSVALESEFVTEETAEGLLRINSSKVKSLKLKVDEEVS
ncbi:MAG: 50S ribosomal protein L10 [Candidatus Aenigmatarchaeota archaeon]